MVERQGNSMRHIFKSLPSKFLYDHTDKN
jgi:hypothetical protein